MEYFLRRYEKYYVEFRVYGTETVLHIGKAMPVKEFLQLRQDLKFLGVKVNNIILEG